MQSVSRDVRRLAAAFVLGTMLLATAPTAMAVCNRERGEPTIMRTFVIWLQSRFSVPGG